MYTTELRLLSGAAMVLGGLIMMAAASKAYGARQSWSGLAAFAAGFLLIGAGQLTFTSDSTVGAWLSVLGAFLCLGSVRAVRRASGKS